MSSSSIKVAVRCRPLNGQERPTGGLDIQSRRILLDSKTYDPDFTFPPTATQDDVFLACRPILQCVKEGMNGTIMVYGQTGTGKTFTMLGNDGAERGLVHRVVADMLEYVQQKTADGAQCALTLSMLEIYNERLTDMLSPSGEEEVTLISGFPRFTHKATLCRVDDAIETIQRGLAWRHTAATMMNERSSRSHVVFIFDLEEYNAFTEQTDVAHLFMIDLAGSESLKKSQATGVAAGEAGKINKSLLALKSVFLALSNTNEATRPTHVPYRDSRLTELLQDSIGGTARTLMIACISAVGRDIEETKSTLLYAVKARSIRNAANTEKEKLLVRLRSMEVENQKLRNRLQERVNERGGYFVTKEEHEQTAEMEDSFAKMKNTVEMVMRDRQSSDARQHIWESQVKVLHALLDDKSAELQRFKEIYYEALRRFEHQASALQRVVRGGVAEAKDVVQLSFADHYARLHGWRTELLNALEEPPMATAVPEERPEEDVAAERAQQQRAVEGSDAHGTHNVTPPVSPMRLDRSSSNVEATAHGAPACSSAATAAAGVGGGRAMVPLRSARGSAASSMQRVSAASGSAPSLSVSPTRRILGGSQQRRNMPPQCSNNNNRCGLRRGAVTSPSRAAASHPPHNAAQQLPPMAPPSPPFSTAAACRALLAKMENEVDAEDGEQTTAAVVEAVGPLLLNNSVAPPSPPQPQQPPQWSAVLAQHDAQCLRAVHRINEAVLSVLDECLHAFDHYQRHAEAVEESRRSGTEELCGRLRGDLDSYLNQLQRVNTTSARDLRDARTALGDQLRSRVEHRPCAEAAPFTQALRVVCEEVVRRAADAFPHPSTPAHAEAAMDAVAHRVQRCSAAFAVQALDPLASSSVASQPGFAANALAAVAPGKSTVTVSSPASPAGSPVFSHPAPTGSMQLDLAPMPRLSPPMSVDGARTTGAGQRAVSSGGGGAFSTFSSVAQEDAMDSTHNTNEWEEASVVSSSSTAVTRAARYTTLMSPPPSQQQRCSVRASLPRRSAPLSAVPMNVAAESVSSRRGLGVGVGVGGGRQDGGCKRTRSNASSQRGEAASRRTTSTHRGLR